ncbi:hypothetical protein ISN76_19205 [Dyella halodurans]|uniref:Uncharacterized protein n=1 Tax=Dyella halodurans TaxID=1920171 RepID=A0ABV9BZY2_9GAMM|nr:hypothetical protein [Dyella halodurans]
MTINWKSLGWMSSVLVAAALAFYGAGLVAQRDRQVRLRQMHGSDTLMQLVTGFGSVNDQVDPDFHCLTLPTGIRLAHQPTSKEWMDRQFNKYADWMVISDRMASGDDVYAYSNITHPPPGATLFAGLGGGYVVLRGWCLVGRLNTWVE